VNHRSTEETDVVEEIEISRRGFVTGAGAASVGLTVALLPSAVAATSSVGGDGGPTTTTVDISEHSILVGQVFFATSPFAGRDRVNLQWTDGESDPVAFSYTITGPFDASPLSGSDGLGSKTLVLSGWDVGETITVTMSATVSGSVVQAGPFNVTFQANRS